MKYLYVANWKMNMTFDQSISFAQNNREALQHLSESTAGIVICPSFVAITPLINTFKNSSIAIGAQNCSEYSLGAYTGEVSVLSLVEAGVAYCIVGHSERRLYHNENTEIIAKKIYLLYATNIVPILFIGETQEEFLNKKTFSVLTQQLQPILSAITQQEQKNKRIIIAYEPVWAIGSGIIPDQQHLTALFAWMQEFIHPQLPDHTVQLLYGGSVNQSNIIELKKVSHIDGFLIGGASTDFEQLHAIITL